MAAAFRRLCVETREKIAAVKFPSRQPPSGGCVLKHNSFHVVTELPSAAFRRLCVETLRVSGDTSAQALASRLQAAVC